MYGLGHQNCIRKRNSAQHTRKNCSTASTVEPGHQNSKGSQCQRSCPTEPQSPISDPLTLSWCLIVVPNPWTSDHCTWPLHLTIAPWPSTIIMPITSTHWSSRTTNNHQHIPQPIPPLMSLDIDSLCVSYSMSSSLIPMSYLHFDCAQTSS